MRIDIAFRHLRNRLRAFVGAERGNVMITFALATIPMVGFIGAAVDYSRGNSAKAAMQSALDATALILSKEAQKMNSDALNSKAEAIFKAQFHRPDVTNLVVTPGFTDSGNGNYKLTLAASGTVPTTFARVIGQEQMNLSVSTDVVWGVKRLELALALDVTGSMASNNKMTELKKAAKSLLTTLKGTAKKDGDVRVAIVPFAVDVNVGTNNVNAAWLDWSDWADEPAIMTNSWIADNETRWARTGPGSDCPFSNSNHGFRCSNGPAHRGNDSTTGTIPSSGANAGLICPSRDNGSKSTLATGVLTNRYHNGCYISTEKPPADWYTVDSGWGADCGSNPNCSCSGSGGSKVCKQKTYTHEWRRREKTAWNGCVRDRNKDYDTQSAPVSYVATTDMQTNIAGASENYPRAAGASSATSDAFQPHQFYDCSAALMQLSFDWTALSDKIDALQPAGNTNVTIGLEWGFHALTSGGPLNAAAPSPDLEKVIVLLTDGDNTQNRYATSQGDIDARTRMACDSVKKASIKLYTIRVIDGNATLLQQCATRSDMYYNVQNASQLNDVFAQIAKNLANLRIAK
jgi:Flp pilus assembly protein TadG